VILPAGGVPPQWRLAACALALAGFGLAVMLTWHLIAAGTVGWAAAGVTLALINGAALVLAVRRPSPAAAIPAASPAGPEPDLAKVLLDDLTEGRLDLRLRAQCRLPDGLCVAVLAQANWRHPDQGQLQGKPLLHFARAHGLSEQLFDATLAQAGGHWVAWQRQRPDLVPPLLVLDLPQEQALSGDLAERVAALLATSGMPAHALRLQSTELAWQQPVATRLAAQGVSLALTGLGAPGGSLGALQHLPVKAVVLDADLVARAAGPGHPRLVVEAIARLAATVGVTTVADGVGSAALAQTLTDLGCDTAQGDAMGPWLDAAGWVQRRDRLRAGA